MLIPYPEIDRSQKSTVRGGGANVLAAATKAITSPVALKWSSNSLQTGELPKELLKNRTHLAIYLLPRAFATLNCPMASEFAELWQFGSSKKRSIEHIKQSYPEKPLFVCHFQQSEFGSSQTIKTVVQSMLEKSVSILPQMALAENALDERWTHLRTIASDMLKEHKQEDQWSKATASFESTLVNPQVKLEVRGPGLDTFLANGEWPLSSDAYGAIGAFAVRSYLEAIISKKAGDDLIYVKPTRVGVRLWDTYDFIEKGIWKDLVTVLGRRVSEFLGIWNDENTDDSILLQNADFQTFREEFMPVYNQQRPAPQRKMVCQDFSAVSDFVTRPIDGGAEYPLPLLRS